MMEYKGYVSGPIEFDAEDKTLHGRVVGIADIIHFEGRTAEELEQAFRDSIDEYLKLCEERGDKPDRAYSGNISLRTRPDLHRKAALMAERSGVSISEWISSRIDAA